jgi:hypothetical protein
MPERKDARAARGVFRPLASLRPHAPCKSAPLRCLKRRSGPDEKEDDKHVQGWTLHLRNDLCRWTSFGALVAGCPEARVTLALGNSAIPRGPRCAHGRGCEGDRRKCAGARMKTTLLPVPFHPHASDEDIVPAIAEQFSADMDKHLFDRRARHSFKKVHRREQVYGRKVVRAALRLHYR